MRGCLFDLSQCLYECDRLIRVSVMCESVSISLHPSYYNICRGNTARTSVRVSREIYCSVIALYELLIWTSRSVARIRVTTTFAEVTQCELACELALRFISRCCTRTVSSNYTVTVMCKSVSGPHPTTSFDFIRYSPSPTTYFRLISITAKY